MGARRRSDDEFSFTGHDAYGAVAGSCASPCRAPETRADRARRRRAVSGETIRTTEYAPAMTPTATSSPGRPATNSRSSTTAAPGCPNSRRTILDDSPARMALVLAHRHRRSFYDGDAYRRLPLGQLGEFGLAVRARRSSFDRRLPRRPVRPVPTRITVGSLPPYLDPGDAPVWATEYPAEFRASISELAGYRPYAEGDVPGSRVVIYSVGPRQRFDFHDPTRVPRGLLVAARDPFGAGDPLVYDEHDLLPTLATDPVGLEVRAVYDLRVLQPEWSPTPTETGERHLLAAAGFVTANYVRGKGGEGDDSPAERAHGVRPAAPSPSAASRYLCARSPVHHNTETDIPADRRDDDDRRGEYSDWLRALAADPHQAEDILFGDPVSAAAYSAADQTLPSGGDVGRVRTGRQPLMSSSAAGRSTTTRAGSSRSTSRSSPPAGLRRPGRRAARPAGRQCSTTREAMRSERSTPTAPSSSLSMGSRSTWATPTCSRPRRGRRTPTTPTTTPAVPTAQPPTAYRDHWNTPASIEVDALGRTVNAVARNGPDRDRDGFTSRSRYDIQGNLVALTDALGREAFGYSYDFAKRRWRIDSHRCRPARHRPRRAGHRPGEPRQQRRPAHAAVRRAAPANPWMGA